MIECNRQWAERLLLDQLNASETTLFEEHLETCASCRELLVEVAGGNNLLSEANSMLASSAELPCWKAPAGESETMYHVSQDSHTEGAAAQGAYAIDLSMLGPTDDPQFMGRIGNYEVQGVIGRGGMGVVFRALDRALNRNVAIKVLDPSMASVGTARQRFALEARAMAAISHEHVVPVYSVDEHRGLPYFAMEYIPGGTLESRIRKHGPLDLLSILRISRQIALALSAAHDCGLVHRDIKPANVLIDRGVERVRVTDFGLARVSSDASHTRSGFIAGTPQFMSPEQVRGEVCTAQSDLFSLGSVMYAMCTGRSPFHSDSIYGSMQRVVHDQPVSIRELSPAAPEWLERFIGVLLEKSPTDRFQDASIVADYLEQEIAYAQNPTVQTKPVRSGYQSQPVLKLHRRMRIAVLGAAIASVIILTAFMVPKQLAVTRSSTSQQSEPFLAPPLWTNDGLQDVQRDALILEHRLFGSEPMLPVDSWSADVEALRQRLEAFEKSQP